MITSILRHTPCGTAVLVGGLLFMLIGAAACTGSDDEAVDLLKDPKVGLAHLNDELHTVRELATDPKLGFEHLNAELHTVKDMLAQLTERVQSLQAGTPAFASDESVVQNGKITSQNFAFDSESQQALAILFDRGR